MERTVGTTFSHSLAMLLSQFLRCFCFFHSWLGSSAMIRGKGASQLCTEKKIGSLEGNALLVSQTSIFIFLCSAWPLSSLCVLLGLGLRFSFFSLMFSSFWTWRPAMSSPFCPFFFFFLGFVLLPLLLIYSTSIIFLCLFLLRIFFLFLMYYLFFWNFMWMSFHSEDSRTEIRQ